MSEQLTELGKVLTNLNIEIEVPDIPLLRYQRRKNGPSEIYILEFY